MEPERTPGQRAYDAYRDSTGGRTHDRRPMPLWADLPPHVQRAWECAGGQVRRDTLHEIVAVLQTFQGEAGL